jgi:hypothetical protein
MTTRRVLLVTALPILVSAALAAGTAPPAHAAPDVIAQRGFGNVHNSYAWGMAWFRGKLYVGTGRYVSCVEAAITDFYLPGARAYRPYKPPSQHCPRSRWDMDLRAEIWRYTPRTGRWERVYRSPTVANARAPGRRIARDIAYRGMTVRRNRRGRAALFVSGVSADEIVPEIAREHPPRLLRTFDGKHFRDIARTFVIGKSGDFTDHRVVGFRGLTWWRGRLFVLASGAYAGDGSVYEVRDPWRRSKPARFRQVTPRAMSAFEMETFNGQLYVGAGSQQTGYSVWKTNRTRPPYRFRPVVTGGAGRGRLMTGVIAMHRFKGHLYVSAVSWYATPNQLPTTEMIRIARDDSWQVTVGRPRVGPDGKYRYPLSGLLDGFDNLFVPHIWRIASQNGTLYAGTLDWSFMLQNAKDWPPDGYEALSGLLTQLLAGELGFDLWATCDGIDWFPVTHTSFNGDMYDFGVRTMVPGGRSLYIGTANHAHGTRVFRYDASDCTAFPRARAASSATARAEHLLADVQRGGTVLSWQTGRQPAWYEVLRSSTMTLPLSFRSPLEMPNGVWFEGQLPELVAPGTPGSTQIEVPMPERWQRIGATTRAYFVDRTRVPGARYNYKVVARGPSGVAATSNVQTVPDPRPAATFQALRRALPAAQAAAAVDARTLWHRRDRAAALARVERLSRAAPSDEARETARRLARRLRYAGVARDAEGAS